MHLPSRVLNSNHNLKNGELKPTNVLNKVSPSRNLSTNPRELHIPKSTPKNPKGNNEDIKNKSKLDKVFCKNEAWQEANIMFREVLKQK
jgi:hypothetical protein